MNKTGIAWTEFTVNPLRARNRATGQVGHYCEKIAPECVNCYAADTNEKATRGVGTGLPYAPSSLPKLELFVHQPALQQIERRRKPCMVFPCSMTDVGGHWVDDASLDAFFAAVEGNPNVTAQVLTKRPERLRDYFAARGKPLPSWLWVGVTAGCQQSADRWLHVLREIPAAVRFVSAEPLLEPTYYDLAGVNWVIVGGESDTSAKARPCELKWIRHVVRQCREAGVACFVKQLGDNCHDGKERLRLGRKGGDPEAWPEDLRVREWPAGAEGGGECTTR